MAKKKAAPKKKPAKPAKKKPATKKPAAKPKPKLAKPAKTTTRPPGSVKPHPPRPKSLADVEAPTAGGATLHALVIGCDCYLPNETPEGSYPSLEGCVHDATRVEQFLRERAGLKDENLILLTSTTSQDDTPKEAPANLPTYANMVNGIKKTMERALEGDHVYIHYSGHGGRCPTIVPKVKGADGLDEGLVPIDIGNSSARYVRDVEIAKLLAEMAQRELIVTMTLDCCHSGGATRAVVRKQDRVGVRGVTFIDRTPRPTDSLVGTLKELEAAAGPAVPASRGAVTTRGLASVAPAKKTVVLAACRPSELAREYPFDGARSQGALTYWFLLAASQGPPDLTFGPLYDTVVNRIHGQFADQTPVIFGDVNRDILDGVTRPTPASIPITKVSGNTVTLGAGQVSLLRVDTELAVWPQAAQDFSAAAARKAIIKVTAVGATTATAQVTKQFAGKTIQPDDRAVPLGVPQKLVRKVRVAPQEGSADSGALAKVRAALAGQTWVEPAGPEDAADFVVTTTPDGKHYQICDAADLPLTIRPELDVHAEGADKKVVARLIHLARYAAVRSLDNSDPFAPLRGKVQVALLPLPAGYQAGDDIPLKLKPFPAGKPVRVKSGDWVALSVTNQSSQELNIVVLDLASNWEVDVANRDEEFHPLEPKQEWRLPLQATLVEGQKSGKDLLKVIATVDPPPRFVSLTLPPLDQPIPPAAQRSVTTRGGPTNPLDDLLAAVSADHPTRAVSTGSSPTRGWTTAQVEIEIET